MSPRDRAILICLFAMVSAAVAVPLPNYPPLDEEGECYVPDFSKKDCTILRDNYDCDPGQGQAFVSYDYLAFCCNSVAKTGVANPTNILGTNCKKLGTCKPWQGHPGQMLCTDPGVNRVKKTECYIKNFGTRTCDLLKGTACLEQWNIVYHFPEACCEAMYATGVFNGNGGTGVCEGY